MKKVNLAALTAGIVTAAFISPLAIGREAPVDMRQGQRHGSVANERQDRVYQNSHQQTQASMSGRYDPRSSYRMENTHTRTRPTRSHTDNSHASTRSSTRSSTRTINDSRNSASTVRPDSFSERNGRTSASAARPDSSAERNYQRPISNGGLRETINNPDISSTLEQERKRRRRAKKQKIRRKLERMTSEVGSAKKFRANLDSNSLGNSFGNSFR